MKAARSSGDTRRRYRLIFGMEILVRRAIDLWPTDFLTYRARGGAGNRNRRTFLRPNLDLPYCLLYLLMPAD